jgi:hypothetical protein
MDTVRAVILVLLAGMASSAVAADLPAEWMNAQPVAIRQTGLLKISVPLETLTAARPALEDLRLYDSAGREVPYLLEKPVQPQRVTRSPQKFQVAVKDDATIITLDTGVRHPISEISVQTPATNFLKAVQLEGSTDGTTWKTLAQGQPLFRQPNGASRLLTSIPPGIWSALRLTLDDRRSAPIPVTGVQLHVEPASAPSEAVEVNSVQRTEEPGQTRLALRLAGANFTLAKLTLETPDPLFTRVVTLSHQQYMENEIRESVISRDNIYRVSLPGQPPAQKLSFAVDVPVRSHDLLLTIHNEDNPPLQISSMKAQRRPVYLTFLAAQGGSYYLLTGNSQSPAPSYDLFSLKANLQGAVVTAAPPGPLARNAAFRPTDALAEIHALGTALDVSDWTYRKAVHLTEGGAQQIELDLEVVSHSPASLRDLRLIRDGRQIPYVVERASVMRSLSPKVSKADDPKRPSVSLWQITLPHRSAPITKLTGTSSSPYFRREVRLYAERQDERGNPQRIPVASGTWVKNLGKQDAPLSLPLSAPPGTDRLVLEIENRDNPPLDLQKVEVWYPVSRVLFKSPPEANTFLYYGNAKASAPQYDLELVVPKLLAAEKTRAALGAEEAVKPGTDGVRFAGSAGWIFWSVLAFVVVSLLFILARLLPKPSP